MRSYSVPPHRSGDGRADLLGPGDPARQRRLEWAALLKRAWALDVLVRVRCASPMRRLALVEDPRTARKILDHLGLPARAPPRARAREQLGFADFDGIDPPSREPLTRGDGEPVR